MALSSEIALRNEAHRLSLFCHRQAVDIAKAKAMRKRAIDTLQMIQRQAAPMPVLVAIDYMQELTDDRHSAIDSLHSAIGDQIADTRPVVRRSVTVDRPVWDYRGQEIAANLRDAQFDYAMISISLLESQIAEYERNTAVWDHEWDKQTVREWRDWCSRAIQGIELCRSLETAR